MRPGVLFCAAAVSVCLLLGGPSVAAASSLIQPDVNVPLPATHLSPSGARAALGSVAGRLQPGNVLPNEETITVGPLTFVAYPFSVAILPPGERTLYFCAASVVPLVDTGVHDAEGVRMVSRDGQLWNHVSAQARYGLDNVNAYRATGDPAYLTRAEAQAQRLIDRHLDVDGAWFHPYDWVWDAMVPPWYSALGQGYALSLFTRLYELTGDATYKAAADGTFASYPRRGPATTPWVSDVDPSGHLWLQEYPGGCECVFNGDMVAALGIYDYYRVTADPRALALFQGRRDHRRRLRGKLPPRRLAELVLPWQQAGDGRAELSRGRRAAAPYLLHDHRESTLRALGGHLRKRLPEDGRPRQGDHGRRQVQRRPVRQFGRDRGPAHDLIAQDASCLGRTARAHPQSAGLLARHRGGQVEGVLGRGIGAEGLLARTARHPRLLSFAVR